MILDRDLPAKLELLPIEKEAFYLLHFVYYLQNKPGHGYTPPIENGCEYIVAQSIFRNKTQQEIGEEVKEHVCQHLMDHRNISCLSLKTSELIDCLANESFSPHQEWCQNCINLSDCLGIYNNKFLYLIVKIFYTWKIFFTKKNLLDSSMSKFLEANSWDSNKMGNYFEKIKPFPNSNLTLLDAWVYANGDVFDSLGKTFLRANLDNYSNKILFLSIANATV